MLGITLANAYMQVTAHLRQKPPDLQVLHVVLPELPEPLPQVVLEHRGVEYQALHLHEVVHELVPHRVDVRVGCSRVIYNHADVLLQTARKQQGLGSYGGCSQTARTMIVWRLHANSSDCDILKTARIMICWRLYANSKDYDLLKTMQTARTMIVWRKHLRC